MQAIDNLKDLVRVDEFSNITYKDKGGFGLVYSSTLKDNSRVAIKMLLPQKWSNSYYWQMFKREFFESQIRAQGMYFIKYDWYVENGQAIFWQEDGSQIQREVTYFVMEYCNLSLFDIIEKTVLSEKAIAYLFWELLKGLRHLHIDGLYHRDIKLENIMFTETF